MSGPLADTTSALRSAGCVFAEEEAALLIAAARTPAELAAFTARRAAGFPLEHIVRSAEFSGLRIIVGPGVFVPRRRSEFLVRQAVAVLGAATAVRTTADRPVVVDLCCGAGAVGLAVLAAVGGAEVHAADIDPAAVGYARQNLVPAGAQVHLGDLYDPLPSELRGRVDLLVVNAPYVPTAEVALMPAEARLHEPLIALDGGPDGVDLHRRIAAGAPHWLAPGGHLLIETSERQAAATAAAMTNAGLPTTVVADEELGATVVIGSG